MKMHNTYDLSDVFYLRDTCKDMVRLIGNTKELIIFLSQAYRRDWECLEGGIHWTNDYLTDYALNVEDIEVYGKRYVFWDGWGRIINPILYEQLAFKEFNDNILNNEKNKAEWERKCQWAWYKGHIWRRRPKYTFRQGPVEGIHKCRGGGYGRKIHYKRKMIEYDTEDYKGYTRKSRGEFDAWVLEPYQCVQRSWKTHRRHQYKDKSN